MGALVRYRVPPCTPIHPDQWAAMGYMIANYKTVTRYLNYDTVDCYGAQVTIRAIVSL